MKRIKMNNLVMKGGIAWLLCTSLTGPLLNARESLVSMVPYPQEVVIEKGAYEPSGRTLEVRLGGLEGRQLEIAREELREMYAARFDMELRFTEAEKADLWIGLLENESDLAEEGYVLSMEKRKVHIQGKDAAGIYYGIQSLRQLFRGNPDPVAVPLVSVRDWPAMSFRCIMDDISRGPIPTMAYMKEQIRRYAGMKINGMSFYIEHVVETRRYPDMAPAEGGISVEEFRELSDYAAGYHMELVGSFQALGHWEKILRLPQFRHLGATERMLDPLNPEALEFLGHVFQEMAPAFSSEYFTPNLDEAWDLSRGSLKGAARELGPAKIYARHVTLVDSMLPAAGKKTFIWGDIILEHPEILDMIPGHVVMGAWNYGASESFARFIDPLTEKDFNFIIAPGVLNSNRLIPDFRMATTNIRNFINEGHEKGALGVYCTVWDDGGPHFFTHDWYGLAYNAEQSWRPNKEALERFDLRFSRAIYGDLENALPASIHALNHLTDLGPTFEMNSNVFYKQLVPARGSKLTFNPGDWKQVEAWSLKSRELLDGARPKVHACDLDFFYFTLNQYDFLYRSRYRLLEAAALYEQACKLQREAREEALRKLEACAAMGLELREEVRALKEEFLGLWDRESRLHWRDWAESGFLVHERDLAEQHALLQQAMEGFTQGRYLPPPTEVRLDIRGREGQYFPYWLLTGSFHLESFDDHRQDFLAPMGGEASARPFPGMKFTGSDGTEHTWIKYDSPKSDELDFKTIFEPHITAVAYAYCTIDSPDDRQVTGLLGSNDGATLWCNGKEVFHFHGKRSLIRDENEITLDLKQGRNHLLIKVEQWKAGWGLSFRLKDLEVRNHKQKYYIQ